LKSKVFPLINLFETKLKHEKSAALNESHALMLYYINSASKRAAVVIDLVLGFLSLLSLIFKNYTKVLPLFPTLSFYALIVNSLQRWQNFCYGFKHLGKAYF